MSYLRYGLNALGRAVDLDYFADGHRGGAIISGSCLCREEPVDDGVAHAIAQGINRQWLGTPLCADFPDEEARPELTQRVVEAMLANISGLRQVGHNVILPTLALKAFRHDPDAVTSARIDGICRLAAAFTVTEVPPSASGPSIPDPGEATAFAEFVLREFIDCSERFLGRGQGWSGHLLTYARALLDLHELGLQRVADQALDGFATYVRRIRMGPQGSDKERPEHPPKSIMPLQADYWKQRAGDWSLGHVLKYPYGYYGLQRHVTRADLIARCEAVSYRIF